MSSHFQWLQTRRRKWYTATTMESKCQIRWIYRYGNINFPLTVLIRTTLAIAPEQSRCGLSLNETSNCHSQQIMPYMKALSAESGTITYVSFNFPRENPPLTARCYPVQGCETVRFFAGSHVTDNYGLLAISFPRRCIGSGAYASRRSAFHRLYVGSFV